MISIRTATINDVPNIRKMHADSWVDTYPNKDLGITLEWIQEYTNQWLTPEKIKDSQDFFKGIFGNPNHYYRVVTDGNNILGMIHASKIDGKQYLGALYIDKKQHGTGVAHKMMDGAFSWFDLEKPIELEVAIYNKRAISFYRKHGFEIDENSEHKFQDQIPSVNMTRKGNKNHEI